MFKKLKEKITEEVKSSPQRIQQFTQSVSDRLQNSAPSDENFFSIGDDDANTSVGAGEPGFSNVPLSSTPQQQSDASVSSRLRRNSNSSMASDVSFLPRYDSSFSSYHLQSDLDASASEIEDNVSSSSSQLGHLTKEQIYSAFQKSQMRYHKYRGRYTDLARHYKDLERDNSKMKSVLVETQDKAIRRVNELKEQCSLEQKAKAHLESALRDELDEKQFKIQTLETKIGLLQNGPSGDKDTARVLAANQTDGTSNSSENLEQLTKYLTEARLEIESLNLRIQEMKASSIVFQTKEHDYKSRIANLEKEISRFGQREKENSMALAQIKMELHNELLSKDAELSNLKQDNEVLKHSLEAFETNAGGQKLDNLLSQNTKLIERVESLTQKCNNYEKEMMKMEQYRLESAQSGDLKNRIKELENDLDRVKEDAKKALLSLSDKIRQELDKEFQEKETQLREDFKRRLDEISKDSASLQDLQMKLLDKDNLIGELEHNLAQLKQNLETKSKKYNELEQNHLELIEESAQVRSKLGALEKDLANTKSDSSGAQSKIQRLEATIATLKQELGTYKNTERENATEIKIIGTKASDLVENLEQVQAKLDQVQQDYEKLSEQKSATDEENRKLQENLTVLEADHAKLLQKAARADELEEQNQALVADLKTSTVQKSQSEETLRNLESDVEKLLQTTRQIFPDSAHDINNFDDAVAHLVEVKSMLNSQENQLRDALQQNAKLEEALQELEQKNLELEARAAQMDDECRNLREDFAKERQNLEEQIRAKAAESSEIQLKIEQLSTALTQMESDYKTLAEDSAQNLSIRRKLEERVRIFEEKDEAVELEKTESKLLEMKVQHLEEERAKLLDNLEKQQKIFEDLLADNSKLKESQCRVQALELQVNELQVQLDEVSTSLARLQGDYKSLAEEKSQVDAVRRKLEERVRIFEEKDEAVELERTESKLLEMKIQKLEQERQYLLDSYDKERRIYEQNSHKEIAELQETVRNLKQIQDDKIRLEAVVEQLRKDIELKEQRWEEERRILEETLHDERQSFVQEDYPNRVKSLQVTVDELNRKIDELNMKLDESQVVIEKYAAKIEQLTKENGSVASSFDSRVEELEQSRQSLVEEISKLEDQLNEKSSQLSQALEKLSIFDDFSEKISNYTVQIQSRLSTFEQILLKRGINVSTVVDKSVMDIQDGPESKMAAFQHVWNVEKDVLDKLMQCLDQVDEQLKESHRHLQISESKYQLLEEEKSELITQIEDLHKEIENIISVKNNLEHVLEQSKNLDVQLARLTDDHASLMEETDKLRQNSAELEHRNVQITTDNKYLNEENQKLAAQIEELKLKIEQAATLTTSDTNLTKENQNYKAQLAELERHLAELTNERQLLHDEIQELKTAPVNLNSSSTSNSNNKLENLNIMKQEKHLQEIESLRDKLTMYKSLDITNKSSIEFYENELQKMKNQNEKLNRKLDETLVTLNHCAELSSSTEVEYLKNVLYNYMLGKESVVLARVIAAVCKFDKQQTETVLAREQQKQTLLGQLGIL